MDRFMADTMGSIKTKAPEGALLLLPEGSTSTAHGPCQLATNTSAHFFETFAQIAAGRAQAKSTAN